MGKIGDLFVRLGLKKEGFDKGIAEASTKTKGFGNVMSSIKGAGIATWAAVGVAAVAAADKFAHASQRFGDAWDVAVSQMKAAWSTFVSALSSWDWENFGSRMKMAMEGAKAVTMADDAAFEVENSIKLRKEAMKNELNDLQIAARNQKLSYKEREAAAKEYLEKVKVFYDQEADIRNRQAYANQMKYLGLAGIGNTENNRKALMQFLTDVVPDENEMKNLLARYKMGQRDIMAELANFYFTGSNDDMVKGVVESAVKAAQASSAYTSENQRMMTLMNSAGAKISTSNGPSAAEIQAQKLKEAAKQVRESWEDLASIGNPLETVGVAVRESCADIKDGLMEVVEATQKADILARNGWKGTFDEWVNWLDEMQQTLEAANQQIRQAIVYGISDSFGTLADAITGVEKIDANKAFASLMKPMADAVTSIGEMVMMQGLAMVAFKASIKNPYAAIAAGAALIAVGQLASSGIQKALNGGTSSSSATSSSSSGTATDYSGELTIYVKGEIKGDAIAISGQKAINSWNR